MQSITIRQNEAGQRFDKYLHKLLKNAPSSFCYKMLRKKNITLNGKKATGTEILEMADVVTLFFSDETYEKFTGISLLHTERYETTQYERAYQQLHGIHVIYEDKDLVIVNKPMGILSQQAKPDDLSANEWLIGYLLHTGEISGSDLHTFKPSVLNRLDRNTTGLLICGKSLAGSQKMSEAIRKRTIEKYYLAIVAGMFDKTFDLNGYLVKDEKMNQVSFFENKAEIPKQLQKEAHSVKTGFRPLQYGNGATLLEIHLYTGKTHQIRAHLSAIGYPILGDPKYGNAKKNEKFHVKHQLLHAYRLKIPEIEGMEISGKTVICPPPVEFKQIMPIENSVFNQENDQ